MGTKEIKEIVKEWHWVGSMDTEYLEMQIVDFLDLKSKDIVKALNSPKERIELDADSISLNKAIELAFNNAKEGC